MRCTVAAGLETLAEGSVDVGKGLVDSVGVDIVLVSESGRIVAMAGRVAGR
jgi:hypothetical protein